MTAYQGNGSGVNATVLAIANKLASTVGGIEVTNTTALTLSTTGWVRLFSQGTVTAQSGVGSEPVISDSNMVGWFQDDSTFDGQTIAAGNYTPVVTLKGNSTVTITADIHCVAVKRPNGGGTYIVIGDIVLAAQTINNVQATYTFSAASEAAASFATGDRFGYIFLLNITANGGGISVITLNMSNTAANGVTNDAQLATPGFSPTVTSSKASTIGLMGVG